MYTKFTPTFTIIGNIQCQIIEIDALLCKTRWIRPRKKSTLSRFLNHVQDDLKLNTQYSTTSEQWTKYLTTTQTHTRGADSNPSLTVIHVGQYTDIPDVRRLLLEANHLPHACEHHGWLILREEQSVLLRSHSAWGKALVFNDANCD